MSMVPGAAAHNAPPRVGRVKMRHLVVRATELETKDGLLIFALEQNIAFEPVAQVDGLDKRDLVAHFPDPRV